MGEPSREQLLLDDEWLRNRDRQVDENHRRSIERSRLRLPDVAAQLVFGENAKRSQVDSLLDFLLCPAADLSSEPIVDKLGVEHLSQLAFRNRLLRDYRLASLLRILHDTPEIWQREQFCVELRDYVAAEWEGSPVKNSWAQTRNEKKLKKDLHSKLNDLGGNEPEQGVKERDHRGRFTKLKEKPPDLE